MSSYNVYRATVGDRVTVTRDGRTNDMTVWHISEPGTGGRAYSAGPRVHAQIRPGGYGDVFDARDVAAGIVQVEPAAPADTGDSCNCRNQSGLCKFCAAAAVAAMERGQRIVTRKLDANMHGPKEFAVATEQELIQHGYVWDYSVFDGAGLCVRAGYSKIESEAELLEFLASGMSRLEWEGRS